jgi:hypothetical protein
MKAAQDLAPREKTTGKWANQPIAVDDDLPAIIKAIGADPGVVAAHAKTATDNVPTREY